MDEKLPPLTQFILPSGGLAAAHLHVARTICRRAERELVPLRSDGHVSDTTYIYINRLSDYLFTLARMQAMTAGKEEVCYKKAKSKD
jgi:cob(I)alamin adenosyltransferase